MIGIIEVDVTVIGQGPAGCSTAISLADRGLHVAMLEKADKTRDKVGESLSPGAGRVLRQLGVWEQFANDGHRPCYGNRSIWGGPEVRRYDFLSDPRGHAWHLDRRLFERRLVERAEQAGVLRICPGSPAQVGRDRGRWRLSSRPGGHEVSARFVVDATGRSSCFARRLGSNRLTTDRQVALVAFLSTDRMAPEDRTTLVEAVERGWWYSAILPDGRLVVSLQTDPDLIEREMRDLLRGWPSLLAETILTRNRVGDCGYTLTDRPRIVAASAGRLDVFSGQDWLAVGDAAMSYDPLSSHGLTVALLAGLDAAAAAASALGGDCHALPAYGAMLGRVYADYEALRHAHYRSEARWPGSVYWERRRYDHG
jgi:flavin-dependent dehydrogenase